MSYLLDTCTLSMLRKQVTPNIRRWFESKNQDLFFISCVTLAELWDGIERLSPSRKKRDLEDWFHGDVMTRFKDRTLPIDNLIALEWGSLSATLQKKGVTIGVQDLYIAATAKSKGLAIITVNVKDFKNLDIPIINPWEVQKSIV